MSAGRRVVPLTGDQLEHVAAPCDACLFWERGEPSPTHHPFDPDTAERARVRKQAWVSTRIQEGCAPGRVVLLDGVPAAWVLFAPVAAFAPRPAPAPRPSGDALQLATLWVEPHLRGHGLGRLLLHATLREAVRLEMAAVEAYADRRWRERGCVLPATWLLREGFAVHREAPRVPLLRLDVRRTRWWAPSLEAALEEVLGRIPRPVPSPEGAARTPAVGTPGRERDEGPALDAPCVGRSGVGQNA